MSRARSRSCARSRSRDESHEQPCAAGAHSKGKGRGGCTPTSDARCFHFSPRLGHTLNTQQLHQAHHLGEPAIFEERVVPGGSTTCAYHVHQEHPDRAIGIVIAGNSGRPGGACGLRGHIHKVHVHHRTQEEDIVSSWMLAEAGEDPMEQDALFNSTINEMWGLVDIDSSDTSTYQGVDYVSTNDPRAFADAWVVRNARVCVKSTTPLEFVVSQRTPCSLIFVAGPNARRPGRNAHGSMTRTSNRRACKSSEYTFFREAVKNAFRAALDSMIAEGIVVAILAQLSGGVYAGPHREKIQQDYASIITELLSEPMDVDNPFVMGVTRGHYFRSVILPRGVFVPGVLVQAQATACQCLGLGPGSAPQ